MTFFLVLSLAESLKCAKILIDTAIRLIPPRATVGTADLTAVKIVTAHTVNSR